MSSLQVSKISKRYGGITAISNVDLEVEKGEMVCFLGPSGCGKTTLLRLIAGFEEPSSGSIKLAERDLQHVPVHQRNMGMVFQSFALFPHLNVGDNIAYPLNIRNKSKAECEQRVNELLELVQLPGLAPRSISQLSGGQRQRVAIARALAVHPDLFLLDEPMSALDAKLREQMQVELRRLQQELGITTIVVTHDQQEAMTMADKIVVLGDGVIQQAGAPRTIYHEPANRFVADFIGKSNMIEATQIAENRVLCLGHEFEVHLGDKGITEGVSVTLMIRPEDVLLKRDVAGANCLQGTVTFVRDIGANMEWLIDCNGQEISALTTARNHLNLSPGETITVEFPASVCRVLTE